MALTVGTDSYISLTDADTYLASIYLSTDTKFTVWTALSDTNCDALMRRACQIIDRQPLVGVKVLSTQTLQFPRQIYSDWVTPYEYTLRYHDLYTQTSVPTNVKYAQCEIAISLASNDNARMDLQAQGVKSYTIGKLSETFGGRITNRIPSAAAVELLRPYLMGAASIV
jgi:hypothetical protein